VPCSCVRAPSLLQRLGQHLLGQRGERDLGRRLLRAWLQRLDDLLPDRRERPARSATTCAAAPCYDVEHAQQHVFGADVVVAQGAGLLLGR